MRHLSAASILLALISTSGCHRAQAPPPVAMPTPAPATAVTVPSPFKLTATIQDIMMFEVDPSADALWESVGTIVTRKGEDDRQPRTEAEWRQARHDAIVLVEATNLLVMDGRKVALPGKKLEDEGVLGIYTAAEAQQAIDAKHDVFVEFAHALHDAAEQMLIAIDAKNPQGMLDAGETMDEVCEGCHMTFWYPNQVIPQFPAEFERKTNPAGKPTS